MKTNGLRAGITACVPVSRGLAALPTLFAVAAQNRAPDRIIAWDVSPLDAGLKDDPLGAATCNFLGVEVVRDTSGMHQALGRRVLAQLADTPILFFVDDDVLPYPSCLGHLIGCYERNAVALVAGQKYDVLPRERTWGPAKTWSRCNDLRPNDIRVPFCDTGLMLVNRAQWLDVDIRYREPSHDIIHTAQVCMRGGGYCAGGAVGLHLRPSSEGVSGWAKFERDAGWLEEHLRPHLEPEQYTRFLAMIGVS